LEPSRVCFLRARLCWLVPCGGASDDLAGRKSKCGQAKRSSGASAAFESEIGSDREFRFRRELKRNPAAAPNASPDCEIARSRGGADSDPNGTRLCSKDRGKFSDRDQREQWSGALRKKSGPNPSACEHN